MKKLLKVFISACIFTLLSFSLSAQISVDPAHSFYKDAVNWETAGYITKLPPLRPYSAVLIRQILSEVMENGSDKAKTKAEGYLAELDDVLQFDVKTGGVLNNKNKMLRSHLQAAGTAEFFNSLVSLGYKAGYDVRTSYYEAAYQPLYSNPTYDSIQDPASVGPLRAFVDLDNVISFGNDSIYFQTGIYRNGFGQFNSENIALNDTAYHSGNFSFTYLNDYFTYTQLLSTIGATSNFAGNYDDIVSKKYLAFHAIETNIIPKVKLGYYENIVFGGRFDPIYLIPTMYMVSQGITGCNDNLQMGIYGTYNPIDKLSVSADLLVDDLSANELMKFNFDSKIRIAGQMGLKYVPETTVFDSVDLTYTLITPYTYSHWEYESMETKLMKPTTYNYQNYTNCGVKIGSIYDPNTDAVKLSTTITPFSNFQIDLGAKFVRHGNVAESFTDEEAIAYLLQPANTFATDGTLYTHSMLQYGSNVDTAWDHLNLLTQKHIMYAVIPEVHFSYKFPKIWNRLEIKLNASYTFEYIHNYGISNNIFPGSQITKTDDGKYTWKGNTYTESELKLKASEIADYYRAAWSNNLTDKFNNIVDLYVTLNW